MEGKGKNQDPLAVAVFIAALIILVGSIFFFIRTTRWDLISAKIREVSDLIEDVSRYAGSSLGKRKEPVRKRSPLELHLERGYRYYKKKRYNSALKEYDKAIEIDPKRAEAYFFRGRIYIYLKKYKNAEANLKKAVELKPDYAEAYTNLGWISSLRKDYDQSIRYMNRSIELNPKSAWAYFFRGGIYFRKGDMERALSDAKTACDLGLKKACKTYDKYTRNK